MTDFETFSDQELNIAAAEALGYTPCISVPMAIRKQSETVTTYAIDIGGIVRYRKEGGGMNPWNPAEDPRQTIEFAEHIRKLGETSWWMVEGHNKAILDQRFEVTFYLSDEQNSNWIVEKDESFSKALTIAALRARAALTQPQEGQE